MNGLIAMWLLGLRSGWRCSLPNYRAFSSSLWHSPKIVQSPIILRVGTLVELRDDFFPLLCDDLGNLLKDCISPQSNELDQIATAS